MTPEHFRPSTLDVYKHCGATMTKVTKEFKWNGEAYGTATLEGNLRLDGYKLSAAAQERLLLSALSLLSDAAAGHHNIPSKAQAVRLRKRELIGPQMGDKPKTEVWTRDDIYAP